MEEKVMTQKELMEVQKQVRDYKKKIKDDTEFLTIEAEFFFASLKHAELKQKYYEVFNPEMLKKPTNDDAKKIVEDMKEKVEEKQVKEPKATMKIKEKPVELDPEQ